MDFASSNAALGNGWTPTSADVLEAAPRIAGAVRETPILTSQSIDSYCGRRVLMKAEHLQITGAYKVRGALNTLSWLAEQARLNPNGVIAASSGNHGLGVAWAARRHGIPATIVLSEGASRAKRAAIEAYGAATVLTPPKPGEPTRIAALLAEERNLTNIPAYDFATIIAGQGTCAHEALMRQSVEVDAIVVPVGGGGIAAGTVLARDLLGDAKPDVYGVEPEHADDTRQSIVAGRLISIDSPTSIADGLLPGEPGKTTFEINRTGLAAVVTVSDSEIGAAVSYLGQRTKQVVEPSAAVTIAALAARCVPGDGPVLAIITGGNVDFPFSFCGD